jgi:uncharacterized hydrophobic protein (TIGR00271 family)
MNKPDENASGSQQDRTDDRKPSPGYLDPGRLKRFVVDEFNALLSVSVARKEAVRQDIIEGSVPEMRYYILLSVSVLIAAIGLIANSPAVVIGAMLISPLMTPIFGISLGLVRGNISLIRNALVVEFGGVALAIFVSYVLGILPIPLTVTPEILARLTPTLLDLGVATLAGFAGCLAIIDERISPVLPGIAMATALVPPLAASGLCLAMGSYVGAWGAFLLFFANFLAILIVSAGLFITAGFVSRWEMGSKMSVLRRFAPAGIGFLVVAVILTRTLVGVVGELRTRETINDVLDAELAKVPGAGLRSVIFKKQDDAIDVLAHVKTPEVLSPRRVRDIQEEISKHLKLNSNLIVRCDIVKDISAAGSTSTVVSQDLDGTFITTDLHSRVQHIQLAEQSLREILENMPGMYLRAVDLVQLETGSVIVATIQSPRPFTGSDVARFERKIQERLETPNIRLLVRADNLVGVSKKGNILYGSAHFGNLPTEEATLQEKIEAAARTEIMKIPNMLPTSVDAIKRDKVWDIRAEVVGPKAMSSSQVAAIRNGVAKSTGQAVTLDVWFRVELVVTADRYLTVEEYMGKLEPPKTVQQQEQKEESEEKAKEEAEES